MRERERETQSHCDFRERHFHLSMYLILVERGTLFVDFFLHFVVHDRSNFSLRVVDRSSARNRRASHQTQRDRHCWLQLTQFRESFIQGILRTW